MFQSSTVEVLERTGAPEPAAERLLDTLSIPGHETPEVDRRLAEVARLPFVASVLGLPDRHQKGAIEVPSSVGIATRGVLVPEFTSVAVNDGMGVLTTDLDVRDLTPERMRALFARIASEREFEPHRHALSSRDLRRVLVHGGRAAARRWGLDPAITEKMENGARIELPGDAGRILNTCFPAPLMSGRLAAAQMGLDFGGNHFLELQVVDEIHEPALAARWGLRRGQLVVMYHVGPGPLAGALLHHYSRRAELDARRAQAFFVSKLWFHYIQRFGEGDGASKWRTHFRRNRWTPMAEDSAEGRAFRAAMAMAMNYGYAYRLATVRAILDALRQVFSPWVRAELLCDVSHNGITEEQLGAERVWVARHNACRLVPMQPTIVAGACDVPSFLGVGISDSDGRMYSYDHGAGHLIETARRAGRLATTRDSLTRVRMPRGGGSRAAARDVAVMRADPIEALMERFAEQHLMRPVVRVRPLGNFKN